MRVPIDDQPKCLSPSLCTRSAAELQRTSHYRVPSFRPRATKLASSSKRRHLTYAAASLGERCYPKRTFVVRIARYPSLERAGIVPIKPAFERGVLSDRVRPIGSI